MAQHRDNTGTCYDPFWQDHANDNLEGSDIAMRYVIAQTSVSLLCWQYRQHDDAKIEEFPSPVCDVKVTHWNQTQQIIRFLMNSAWVLCWWFFKRTWCVWLRCCGGMGIISQRMRELRRLLTQSVFDLKLCHIDDFCFFFSNWKHLQWVYSECFAYGTQLWMNEFRRERSQRSDGYIRIHNWGIRYIRYKQKLFNVVELIWVDLIQVDLSWFELNWFELVWVDIPVSAIMMSRMCLRNTRISKWTMQNTGQRWHIRADTGTPVWSVEWSLLDRDSITMPTHAHKHSGPERPWT